MLVKAKRKSDGKTVWVDPEKVTSETHEIGEVKKPRKVKNADAK